MIDNVRKTGGGGFLILLQRTSLDPCNFVTPLRPASHPWHPCHPAWLPGSLAPPEYPWVATRCTVLCRSTFFLAAGCVVILLRYYLRACHWSALYSTFKNKSMSSFIYAVTSFISFHSFSLSIELIYQTFTLQYFQQRNTAKFPEKFGRNLPKFGRRKPTIPPAGQHLTAP